MRYPRRTSLLETTRAIVGDAFRDLRGSWRALALTDLAYKLVSFALLTPATLLLLRWAMARTGTAVVADVEIASFFLTTRPGILSLILGGAILSGITALEMACLMAIGLAAANGRELNVRGALAFGASRSRRKAACGARGRSSSVRSTRARSESRTAGLSASPGSLGPSGRV